MKLRHRFRLVLVDGETYAEVTTSGIDMARAERAGQSGDFTLTMRTVHEALLRQKRPVPARFESFLESVDELVDLDDADDLGDDLDPDVEGELPDPTQPADSPT